MCTNIIAGIRKGNQILIGGSDTIAEKFRQVILKFGQGISSRYNVQRRGYVPWSGIRIHLVLKDA